MNGHKTAVGIFRILVIFHRLNETFSTQMRLCRNITTECNCCIDVNTLFCLAFCARHWVVHLVVHIQHTH